MVKLNLFLVSYDRLDDRAISALDDEEVSSVKCYAVQKSVPKSVSKRVEIINEWELPWNDYSFQSKQYYEYGTIVHLINNEHLLEGLTHVGLLHYDVLFNKNSVNDLLLELNKNPNKIFYQRIRGTNDLYLSKYEVDQICKFMSDKLNILIDSDKIWINGWISEALSVTPIDIFKKFGNFIIDNRSEIEDILLSNRWGIMNHINHRICGIVERMWGFYLVSIGSTLEKMNIEHDWNSYTHKHQSEENWIKNKK
jgi:hypothetical protein